MPRIMRGLTDGYIKFPKSESVGKKKKKIYRRHCIAKICNKWTVMGILFVAWLVWLIWYLTAKKTVVPVQSYAHLVKLPQELANEEGAYCLDGSPPGYYFRKGRNSGDDSWIIVLPEGGWCYNISHCYERSSTELGSSHLFPSQVRLDGMLSSDPAVSPDFYNWNIAYLAYCDGASFSGNADMPTQHEDKNIYFRGKRVLDLLLDYLLQHGLSKSERVILTGVSAGGIAAYIHADHIQNKIAASSGASFHALVDAGYIPDVRNITNFQHIRIAYQRIYNFQQVQGSLNEACLAGHDRNNKWKCFFPQYSFPYIKTPMFVLNSMYDYWTIWYALDLRCYPDDCDTKGKYYYTYYLTEFTEISQPLFNSTKDAVYISSCYAHSQASDITGWTTYFVNGTTPQMAFSDWYFGSKSTTESRYRDCTTPGCNPTCDWSLEHYDAVKTSLSTSDFFI